MKQSFCKKNSKVSCHAENFWVIGQGEKSKILVDKKYSHFAPNKHHLSLDEIESFRLRLKSSLMCCSFFRGWPAK